MKKTLIALLCLLFCLNARAQHIKFADLVYLLKQQSAKEFMAKKNFTLTDQRNSAEDYVLGPRSENEEMVYYSHQGVSYMSLNAKYINALIAQVPKEYKLNIKDDSAEETFYQFGRIGLSIIINVSKKPNTYSSIGISGKP